MIEGAEDMVFDVKWTKDEKYLYVAGFRIFSYHRKLNVDDYIGVLNEVVDITSLPKATGKLRKLQIADTLLLKWLHKFCEKNDIKYWLKDGTLLGAIRHKGFIPWDDDLDVCILSTDYDRFVAMMKKEVDDTDLYLYGIDNSRYDNGMLRITHKEYRFVNLDVVVMYPTPMDMSEVTKVKKLWDVINRQYSKDYRSFLKYKIDDKFILAKIRQKAEDSLIDKIGICDLEESASILQEASADFDFRMFKKEHIFPLKRGCFEGLEIWLPNEPDKILQECYGDYMSFPKDINHHSDMFLNFTEGEIDAAITALEKI